MKAARPQHPLLCAMIALACTVTPARAADDGVWSPFVASGFPSSTEALTAVDAAEHRIYLLGPRTDFTFGSNSNETYVLDLSLTPPRFLRVPTVSPPPPRVGAALVFDPLRRSLLLIGGRSTSTAITETEVWELALTDPPRWTRLEPEGAIPAARSSPVAVYDPIRDRVLVYGGAEGQFSLDDTWALELSPTPSWSRLTTAGSAPPALAGAVGIYDSRRDRLMIYAGGTGPFFNDPRHELWRLSLSGTPTWSLEPVQGIAPRSDLEGTYDAAYDSTTDRMIVVSSHVDSNGPLAVASINLGAGLTWEPVASTGDDPGDRFEAAVGWLDRRLVCIGGQPSTSMESDAHALDIDTRVWTDLEPLGVNPPFPVPATAAAVIDSAGARVFAWFGSPPGLWALSLDSAATWQRPIVTGPVPSAGSQPVWDPAGARLLLVDGGTQPAVRVWELRPGPTPAWSILPTTGLPPPASPSVGVALDGMRDRILVFEGSFSLSQPSRLWQLHLGTTSAWDTLPSLPGPALQASVICDEVRDLLVLVGGYHSTLTGSEWQSATWTRPLEADSQPWTLTNASGTPPGGPGSFVYDPGRDRFLQASANTATVHSLVIDPGTDPALSWSTLSPPPPPPGTRVSGPGVMDAERDRLLFPFGAVLRFGSAAAPALACPEVGSWSPGSIREVSFALTDLSGQAFTYEFELRCERAWPGFPIRGLATPAGFSTEFVPIGVPVPDSAAFGDVRFDLSVSAREQVGLDVSCSFSLFGEAAPVVALGADAQPDRVVVRWQTTQPGLTVTVSRRSESGPWTALTRKSVAAPGVVTFEDHLLATDQRYYYRAELSDPTRAGAYGQIRVDVPQWALGFVAEQPNPVRGRFSVQCAVPTSGRADLDVFDINGRRAYAASQAAGGPGRLTFDVDGATRLSPGVYFMRLTQAGHTRQRTIVFLR